MLYLLVNTKGVNYEYIQKIKKEFHNEQKPVLTQQKAIQHKVKYNFVEQYTLADPKKQLIDHNLWALCEKIPVAYEQDSQDSGWLKCVPLNTSVILPFLNALKLSPATDTDSKKMRTISIVHITNDVDIYILPVLPLCKNEKTHWLYWVNNKCATPENTFPKNWTFYMTPDIRRAIAAQMKVYQ